MIIQFVCPARQLERRVCTVCVSYVSAYTDVCYSFINVKSTTPMTLVPVLKSKTGRDIAL